MHTNRVRHPTHCSCQVLNRRALVVVVVCVGGGGGDGEEGEGRGSGGGGGGSDGVYDACLC